MKKKPKKLTPAQIKAGNEALKKCDAVRARVKQLEAIAARLEDRVERLENKTLGPDFYRGKMYR